MAPASPTTVFDWLVDGAPGATTSAEVLQGLGDRLGREVHVLDRLAVFVHTLHPEVAGRWFRWSRGGDVRHGEVTPELMASPAYVKSPIEEIIGTGGEIRVPLGRGPTPYTLTDDLAREGFNDYVALPMRFIWGTRHFVSFATKHAAGFSADEVAEFRRIVRPLSRVAEIYAFHRTAANLLSTYVGRNAGERVLAGHIQRGHFESLRAIIWFSDMRGFTAMSSRLDPGAIVAALNDVFDCQVTAVQKHGGEILKFMGDGMLAVFPVQSDNELGRVSSAALEAADGAFAALAALGKGLRIGLALHVGEVAYGNIGGASRLDFTVIGSAVNVASRLEGLTSKVGRPVLVSEELAQHVERPLYEVGTFELKGVAAPQRVFATSAVMSIAPPPAG